jgi:hypothetical protein
VSWWGKNQRAMVPVARISTDARQTFEEKLTANPFGTIGTAKGKNLHMYLSAFIQFKSRKGKIFFIMFCAECKRDQW